MPDFDILTTRLRQPYPTFAEMRRDAPCYYDTRLEAHILTRYRDVERALGGEEFSAERVDQWGKGAPEQVQDELAFFTRELKRWIPSTTRRSTPGCAPGWARPSGRTTCRASSSWRAARSPRAWTSLTPLARST